MNSDVTAPLNHDGSWSALARAVFAALLKHGTLTRAAIAELTGLSRVSASGVVDQLIHRGFVEHVGSLPSSGGPNARAYSLASDAAYAVGVAVDLDRIAVMTTDVRGAVVSRHDEPIDDHDAVVSAVHRAITAQLRRLDAPLSKLRYVVLGAAGVVDPLAHELAFATNRTSWQPSLAAELRARLKCPAVFENDVNLAALAEARLGAGKGAGDLVLVWVDTGIACGAILGGRLFRGASGWAGELGFVPAAVVGAADKVPDSPVPVATTLQQSIGIKGVIALAKSKGVDVDRLLRFETAAPDDAAEPVLTELVGRIAAAVAAPVLVFDPGLVVLAGCIVRCGGDALLGRVRAQLAAIAPIPVRVEMSQTGPDAILAGAMLLALDHARDNLFEIADETPTVQGAAV
jgi:predicted NBD/HSP70 family sugar kinase